MRTKINFIYLSCFVMLVVVLCFSDSAPETKDVVREDDLKIVSAFTGKEIVVRNTHVKKYYNEIYNKEVDILSVYFINDAFDMAIKSNLFNTDDIPAYFENSMKFCFNLPVWERERFLKSVLENVRLLVGEDNEYSKALEKNIVSAGDKIKRLKGMALLNDAIIREKEVRERLIVARLEYAKELVVRTGDYFYKSDFRDYQIRNMTKRSYADECEEILNMRRVIQSLEKVKEEGGQPGKGSACEIKNQGKSTDKSSTPR